MLSADPRLVPNAQVIDQLSYNEAMELAYFGAKVIHPQTMEPAVARDIPIFIRNTFAPEKRGTLICANPVSALKVKGITTIDPVALVNLEGAGMIGVPGTAHRLFGALRDSGISVILISQASSEHSICFAIPEAQAVRAEEAVRRAFDAELRDGQIQHVDVGLGMSILAVVGDGMAGAHGVAAKVFNSLGDAAISVRAIAQGASERNISVVVDGKVSAKALRAVHAAFYLSPNTLSIGLIGPGTVGRVLLAQIQTQIERLRALNLDLRVRGIASSKRMLLEENAVDLDHWAERLAAAGEPLDLEKFANHVQADYIPHTVIVDCTASAEVGDNYAAWLTRGIHVVTPNKKANSGTLPYYRELQEARRAAGTHYLYEATVGAGLPIIQTLRDLRDTGDEITRIEGIFSGTLAYLFNVFDGSESFSSIVRAAKAKGYTEPDPRDDLSGMDVARKLIILAREMGLTLEMADVRVEGLVPKALEKCSVDEFMARLPEFDCEHGADLERGARQEPGAALRRADRCRRHGDRRFDAAGCQARLRQHCAHRQRGALRDSPLLRQSLDRAGSRRRSRSDRRRRVLGSVASVGLSGSAPVMLTDVTAFAPATVANVGIGFDILGHTVEAVGDKVRLRRIEEPVVRIRSITGIAGDLPVEPAHNTAGRAVQAMHAALALDFGFEMDIEKGIPLGSGLGGSAASAVAAVVAANALLRTPVPRLQLLKFAMEGEIVASGSAHIDNIAPCLFGGLTLTVGIDHPRVKQIPVPPSLRCVLAHPHMYLGTREARAILKTNVTRSDFVWASANLAGFISGCYSNDLDMIRESFNDVIIEPQRHSLIPGFQGRAARRHVGRRAGLLDLRRGPDGVRLGRDPVCRGGSRRHGGGIRRPWPAVGLLDFRHGKLRRPSGEGLMSDLRFVSSRGARAAGELERGHRAGAGAGRRPVRADAVAGGRSGRFRRAVAPAGHRARGARRFLRRRSSAAGARRDRGRGARSARPDDRGRRLPGSACSRSSSFTGRPRPSRISARAFSPRVCSAWKRTRRPG